MTSQVSKLCHIAISGEQGVKGALCQGGPSCNLHNGLLSGSNLVRIKTDGKGAGNPLL